MTDKQMMHVFGGFKTDHGARFAAEQLKEQGVPESSIGLLVSEQAKHRFATIERHTKAPEGIAAGGVAGGVLGALAAGLTSVAAIVMPGVGLLAAGPLVSTLAGLGAGATAGGVLGGIVGLGIADHEAKLYDQILKEDGVLVTVSTDDKRVKDLAERVFRACGALQLEVSTGATARI